MKRFSLILLSLLLIAACAGSFAEEAPWVTMENVREHSGYVWREEIQHWFECQNTALKSSMS